ncbi:hypothetical protein ACHAWF_013391 [Thalassiosira exigua]
MVRRAVGCLCATLAAAMPPGASASAFVPTEPAGAVDRDRSHMGSSTALRYADPPAPVAPTTASDPPSVLRDFDHHSSNRLPYSPTGYSRWEWRRTVARKGEADGQSHGSHAPSHRHSINYLEMGDPSKPALLLIHGFGASSYHFRHNVPTLARTYHVFAIDLLGFGWSDKPVLDYDADLWRDQVVDFIEEVVMRDGVGNGRKRSVAIAGNSMGGFAAMHASSDERIKDCVKGCILLNAAGKFCDPSDEPARSWRFHPVLQPVTATVRRALVRGRRFPMLKPFVASVKKMLVRSSFAYAKHPPNIEHILRQVYVDHSNVDAELVESIQRPALDGTAAEVFQKLVKQQGQRPRAYLDDLLKELECPLLLAWGVNDPFILSSAADKMQRLHAVYRGKNDSGGSRERRIERVSIDAGHCPHDEAPHVVNRAILDFLETALC